MIGIYKITSPSNKVYIGQSINVENRWKYFYRTLNCKAQPKLFNSLKKYGWEQHKFEIIEECTKEQLNEKEIYWGNFYNVLTEGLNCKLGEGKGACSKETKQKMSKARLGKKDTQETKIKKSNSLKNKPKPKGFGESHSKKIKNKPKPKGFGDNLSKQRKGNWIIPQHQIEAGIKARNKPTIQYDLQGNFIKEHESAKHAAIYIGVHEVNMRFHLNGKYKTCKRYIFRYKEHK